MLVQLKQLWKNEEGATAIEYGLIAALIAVAIVGVLALIGPELKTTFTKVDDSLKAGNAAGS